MVALAWVFMSGLTVMFIMGLAKAFEAASKGGKHNCSISFSTVFALIFAGRILGWW